MSELLGVRAVIYARVSEDDVAKGRASAAEKVERASVSIRAQMTEGRGLCEREEYVIVKELDDDGVSGWKRGADRESFRALLRLVAGRHVDVIVCRALDRLGRNDADNSAIREAARRAGVSIHTFSGARLDPAQSSDAFQIQMLQAVAELDSAQRSEKIRNVNAQRRAEGVLRPTTKAFGWQWEKGNPTASMRADEREAELVRELYRRVIQGDSLYAIAQDWTAREIPTVKGAAWSIVALRAILLRPSNARLVRDGKRWDYLPDVRGTWDELVDEATYRRARDILTSPSRRTNAGRKGRHLVSGIARCGHPECGAVLRPSSVDDKKGGRLAIYRCISKIDRPSDLGVRHVSARADTLDAEVRRQVVAAFVFGPVSLFPGSGEADAADEIHNQLDEVAGSKQKLLTLVATPDLGVQLADVSPQLSALRARETELRRRLDEAMANDAQSMQLADLRAGLWTPAERVSTARAVEYSRALGAEFDALPIESRRALVRHLLDVTVQPLGPGVYGSKRWAIRHKIVTSLNAENETDAFAAV
jgi:DNA invertase Pin-like site-specific DNA recombinase